MPERKLVDVPIRDGVFTDHEFRAPGVALRGSRCGRCHEAFFPARRVCPRCHRGDSVLGIALGRRGHVYAVTEVVRPAAFYPEAYTLALVDLPEGVRVLGQVKGPAGSVRIGADVELVVEPMFETPDGQRVWGYRFAAASPPPSEES